MASVDSPPSLRTVLPLYEPISASASKELISCQARRSGGLTSSQDPRNTEQGQEWYYGGEENAQDREVGHKRDQDDAEQDHGSVLVHEIYKAVKSARQEREDHLRAVEWGDRDQVEDEEQCVGEGDHDHEYEQVAARISEGWQQVKGGAEDHDQEVRDGSCEGYGHGSEHATPELGGYHRRWPAPPEAGQEKHHAAQQVEVCELVQGHPTVAICRVVAKEVGRGRVGRLVHRYTYDQAEEEGHSGGWVDFEESQEHGCSYDTRMSASQHFSTPLRDLSALQLVVARSRMRDSRRLDTSANRYKAVQMV